jgi:membrane protein, MarC family
MFFVLATFFIAGNYILSFFGLSLHGIRIAGGLMLGRSAFDMLNPKTKGEKLTQKDVEEAHDKPDVSFSPMAMPLLSGPGSIATVIALAAEADTFMMNVSVILAILLLSIVTFIVLRVSPYAVKLLGNTGLAVLTKIMGFIVLCVSVQFIINGVIPLITEIIK